MLYKSSSIDALNIGMPLIRAIKNLDVLLILWQNMHVIVVGSNDSSIVAPRRNKMVY